MAAISARAGEAANAALAGARSRLAAASAPFRFVTNWCYSKMGTHILARLVGGWTNAAAAIAFVGCRPRMSTASWEATGVLYRGGVPETGRRPSHERAAGEENFAVKGRFP